jgi:hypothetical protein
VYAGVRVCVYIYIYIYIYVSREPVSSIFGIQHGDSRIHRNVCKYCDISTHCQATARLTPRDKRTQQKDECYSSLLGNSAPMNLLGRAHVTCTYVFSVWSVPFPVLGKITVNTSTIIEGVFYAWSVSKIYRGQQRSFVSSRNWEAVSQGYEAVMENSVEGSAV